MEFAKVSYNSFSNDKYFKILTRPQISLDYEQPLNSNVFEAPPDSGLSKL